MRSRTGGGSKVQRFVRVTGLQRSVAVRANESGAFAALREPYHPPDIIPVGKNLAEDLACLRPYFSFTHPEHEGRRVELNLESSVDPAAAKHLPEFPATGGEEEDEGDGGGFEFEAELLARDAQEVMRLWDILVKDRIARRRSRSQADPVGQGQGLYATSKLAHGADLMLRIQNSTEFPAHRIVLSARCAVLARVLGGLGSLHDRESGISFKLLPVPVQRGRARSGSRPPQTSSEAPRLAITGVHPFSVLVLLHYLYTDVLLPINDLQLARLTGTADAFAQGRLQPSQAVGELQTLARVLHLEALAEPLRSVVRCAPSPSLNAHFRAIFDAPVSMSSPDADVVLRLADRNVRTHSFVLRARSLFFECFFADEEWTRDRWESDGILRVDLCHLEWRVMQYVLRFMCCGEEEEMFERIGMWTPVPFPPYSIF